MLFNSTIFALFFTCYLILHHLCPAHWRIWLVIGGSAVFYGYWNWAYVWLPFALAMAAFALAGWAAAGTPETRRRRLAAGAILLLVPLIAFKYPGVLAPVLGLLPQVPALHWELPLGISFVTFTLLAFLFDTHSGRYREPLQARWLLGYVLFFPHLIAGPILRPHELIPQLRKGMAVRTGNLLPGLALIAAGLFKKVVLADSLGSVLTPLYARPEALTAVESLFAVYAFPVQMYCDLSGYTDIALGLARILGVRLPGNFRQPFTATSFSDFWRRWHITLSNWFRDYVFYALPRRLPGAVVLRHHAVTAAVIFNMLVTMVLIGLWHGGRWTFAVWGLANGAVMAFELLSRRHLAWPDRIPRLAKQIITFQAFALLAVLFRAPDFTTAGTIVKDCLGAQAWGSLGGFVTAHPFECLLLPLFFLAHPWDDTRRIAYLAHRAPPRAVIAMLTLAMTLVGAMGMNGTSQFIYFEF